MSSVSPDGSVFIRSHTAIDDCVFLCFRFDFAFIIKLIKNNILNNELSKKL